MAKSQQLVFIDDSGDPGFKDGASSSHFVLAAALFIDPATATLVNDAISKYRRSKGWQDEAEFKFSKSRKAVIIELLQIVVQYDFQIYATYLNKADCSAAFKFASDGERLYNWATKELLELIPMHEAIVKIDGRSSRGHRLRVASYLRHEINIGQRKIKQIKTEDSVKDNLIQLADLIAGAINRSMQPEKTDAQKYLAILHKKVAAIKRLDLNK